MSTVPEFAGKVATSVGPPFQQGTVIGNPETDGLDEIVQVTPFVTLEARSTVPPALPSIEGDAEKLEIPGAPSLAPIAASNDLAK